MDRLNWGHALTLRQGATLRLLASITGGASELAERHAGMDAFFEISPPWSYKPKHCPHDLSQCRLVKEQMCGKTHVSACPCARRTATTGRDVSFRRCRRSGVNRAVKTPHSVVRCPQFLLAFSPATVQWRP